MNLIKFKNTFSAVLFLMAGTMASAKTKHPATGEIPRPPVNSNNTVLSFIENKGQWNQEAKYKAGIPGGALFITDKGFVYSYLSLTDLNKLHEESEASKENLADGILHTHGFRVNFVGANSDVKYKQADKRSYYHNYFIGNDASKWAGNVSLYGSIVEQNIYQGIDVKLYSKGTSFKYDFVVAPGANASQIKLSFEGVNPEITPSGNLKFVTSVNTIEEEAPYTYQVIDGKKVEVKCQYSLDKGILSFAFPEGYNTQYELTIDPILVFSTYSGSTTTDFSHATTYDSLGNLYAASYVTGTGWPVLGAAQGTWGGSSDVGINKYNATGSTLLYSTYYGGFSAEYPHSMFVNNLGELVVAGVTSSSNLPVSIGAYDNTLSGTADIFVVHFNAAGSVMLGSTYMGGNGWEPSVISNTGASSNGNSNQNTTSPVEINVDNTGNIWIVSSTPSSDFPVTTNAQQPTISGANDGVIFKLNPACSQLLYSSFLGGSGTDGIFGIQFNSLGNVVVCGSTQSTNFPTTTGALATTAPGGTCDGFVTVINQTTGALMNSTYVGTNATDQAVNLQIDNNNNIYVLGRTTGNYPISTGVYSMANSDCFIDKLSPTLSSSLLSTRVGGSQTGSRYFPTAFLLDICQNIYVAGLSESSGTYITGLPTTANAFDATPRSFYFCVLNPNFSSPLMQSYFGSNNPYYDHTHVGVNRMDPQGIIYHSVCANAPTGSFPTTASSVFPTKLNSGQDILSFKFNFEATGVNSNFALDTTISRNDTGCAPYSVHFLNNSTQAMQYTWDFGDGTTPTNTAAPTHLFNAPGVYTVALHANNPASCITDDTSFMTITVLQTVPPDFTVNDTILCTFEQNINIGLTLNNPTPNNTIQWGPANGIVGANNTPDIVVDPTISSQYYVVVKDTIPGICGFSKSDTVHIDLRPRVLDIVNSDTVVCEGAIIPVTAVGTNGYVYTWSPSTGISDSTVLSPIFTINQPNFYTLTAHYPGCPDTAVTLNIGMHFMPHLTVSPDIYACQWTDVALESNVSPFRNDYSYSWTPATANLTNPTGPNTHLIVDSTIMYRLHVSTPIGCADDDSLIVTVYPGGFGSASNDTGYCPGLGSFASLTAEGGNHYQWSPALGLSDSTIANPIANPRTTTEYTVLITDIHNCKDTETVNVRVYPAAQLNMADSVSIYPGEVYQMEPNSNCSYFAWFPPSGLNDDNISNPTMSPSIRTRYFVNAKTENGCEITDSIDVLVKETVIDMPNAFKPNGTNNLFKPSKRGIAKLNSFNIFNRWGNKVYSSSNPDEGWDGNYNGKPQPMGVYMYVIDAVTDSGKPFIKQGNVTLLR